MKYETGLVPEVLVGRAEQYHDRCEEIMLTSGTEGLAEWVLSPSNDRERQTKGRLDETYVRLLAATASLLESRVALTSFIQNTKQLVLGYACQRLQDEFPRMLESLSCMNHIGGIDCPEGFDGGSWGGIPCASNRGAQPAGRADLPCDTSQGPRSGLIIFLD